jgi:hypothetical protein
VDSEGNVHITGISANDYGTVKYDAQGDLLWEQLYNGPNNGLDEPAAIVVDKTGNVYVTGTSVGLDTGDDYVTVKYTPSPTAVEEPISTKLPDAYVLEQNYPNPFNPSTTIQFSVIRPGQVTLKIFNLLGGEVATLVDKELRAGQYKVTWNARGLGTGMYMYQLQAKGFVETRKLLLLK